MIEGKANKYLLNVSLIFMKSYDFYDFYESYDFRKTFKFFELRFIIMV